MLNNNQGNEWETAPADDEAWGPSQVPTTETIQAAAAMVYESTNALCEQSV